MKTHRTQVNLDDEMYQALRKEAFVREMSLAELIRRALTQYLELDK